MSEEEKMEQASAPEKKMTSYDQKMARRAQQKEKDERDAMLGNLFGILIILALVAMIASFPIRSYLSVNGTAVTVGGEKFSNVEFDYYKKIMAASYLSNYGTYLSYYGIDINSDLTNVSYDGELTFGEYFEQLAVEHLQETVALHKEMAEKNFTYDVSSDYQKYLDNNTKQAKERGISVAEYVASAYGEFATEARIAKCVKDSLLISAYYDQLREEMAPSAEEMNAYYEEHKDDYDLVDFRVINVEAQLPKEPTELADEGAAVADDGTYTPSEAEKEAAMEEAHNKALDAKKDMESLGLFTEGMNMSSISSYYNEWLFAAERKPGDFTVFDNSYGNVCYAVEFVDRKKNEANSFDLRIIVTNEDNGDQLLAEYNADPTEEKFIQMVSAYSIDSNAIAVDGLFENQTVAGLDDSMVEWTNDPGRKKGDVSTFFINDMNTYAFYFVSNNGAKYLADIKEVMTEDVIEAHIDEIAKDSEVVGKLRYLEVQKEREAAEAAEAAGSDNADAASETTASETTAE